MSKFVVVSFMLLAWTFYEMSGGADFEPRGTREMNVARTEEEPRTPQRVAETAVRTTVTPAALVQTAPASTNEAQEPIEIAALEPAATELTLASLDDGGFSISNPLTVFDPAQEKAKRVAAEGTDAEPREDLRSVTGNRVNMRTGPGTTYNVIAKLDQGALVNVLEDPGDGWVKLKPMDGGPVGWMTASLVTPRRD